MPGRIRLVALSVCAGLALVVVEAWAADDPIGPSGGRGTGPGALGATSAPDDSAHIQTIFNRRCIACHGCLGSPCNVKLDSFRGVDRGGFGENPYTIHLAEYPRTHMDAVYSTEAWRERGFYPILARGGLAPENLDGSLLFQMVEAGVRQNTPGSSRKSVDAARKARFAAACPPTAEASQQRLREHPGLGMPFGLPAISRQDLETLKDWVVAGSPGPTPGQLAQAGSVANPTILADWEALLNDPDARRQLVSRFIFEHLYQATIVLEESPGDRFQGAIEQAAGSDHHGRGA